MFTTLMEALLKIGLGFGLVGTVIAASGGMESFFTGWYQLSQVLGG